MLVALSLCLFFCDAGVKYLVFSDFANIRFHKGIEIFHDFWGVDFCINCVTNQGGAWGIFAAYPKLVLALRISIILALFVYAIFINRERRRELPLWLILTGALSNIVDYLFYGCVVDMFHFTLWNYSFPVFNIADTIIFLGSATLLVQSIHEQIKSKRGRKAIPF